MVYVRRGPFSHGSKCSQVKANVLQRLIGEQFCYKAQQHLSSIASNYNRPRLLAGISIGLAAASVALFNVRSLHGGPLLSTSNAMVILAIAYALMMFASSYVEEEQQFWYWLTSGWVTTQYLRT